MIFIYTDFGGTHSTALAAAYHLNKLPMDRKLTKEEILNVDYFNKLKTEDMGKIIFHGVDENGNPVYTIGCGASKIVVPAMKHLGEILQKHYQSHEKIIFSNTSPTVPLPMTFGGLFLEGFTSTLLVYHYSYGVKNLAVIMYKDLLVIRKKPDD